MKFLYSHHGIFRDRGRHTFSVYFLKENTSREDKLNVALGIATFKSSPTHVSIGLREVKKEDDTTFVWPIAAWPFL